MNRQMTLKGASAKAQGEGSILVRLVLEVATSADLARDFIQEAGEMLDQEVDLNLEAVQTKMPLPARIK